MVSMVVGDATTETAFSSHFVSSVEDFRAIFSPHQGDQLLLCHEAESDGVSVSDLDALESTIATASSTYGARLKLHLWDCSSAHFAAAKAQLAKERGTPLLLIVQSQSIADTLRAPLPSITEDVPRVCERLALRQRTGGAIVSTTTTTTTPTQTSTVEMGDERLVVDVSRLLDGGRRLLSTGQALYAEKFFQRAVCAVEAVSPEVLAAGCAEDRLAIARNAAVCLAWAAMAYAAQGKPPRENAAALRLERDFAAFCAEPLGDAARARGMLRLLCAAPTEWGGEVCSQRRLRRALDDNPRDHSSRSALIITLFMAGDMERCLTEALKLHAMRVPFGEEATTIVKEFLGPDHPLVAQLFV